MEPIHLIVLVLVYLAAAILVFARRSPGYSHVRHTIGKLGEIGAPGSRWVSFGVFLPVGLGLMAIVRLERYSHPAELVLALSIAAGYLIAAFFPSGPGSRFFGSLRRGVHTLGAVIEYLGGALALVWLSELLGPVFGVVGLLVGIAMIGSVFQSRYRGLLQRVGESGLLGGLALAVWLVR